MRRLFVICAVLPYLAGCAGSSTTATVNVALRAAEGAHEGPRTHAPPRPPPIEVGARWPTSQGRLAATPDPPPTHYAAPTGNPGCLTAEQVANYARAAGFPESAISTMVGYAARESGFCPGAVNASSGACGLWQIYPAQPGCLDPATNAHLAFMKYQASGFSPWGG